MFRQRTSAQNPRDDLLANFKQKYPEVATALSSTSAPRPRNTAAIENPTVVEPAHPQERGYDHSDEASQDQDPILQASNGPWCFTPSLLDPTSFSFANVTNSTTLRGNSTPSHPQAVDLQTTTLGLKMDPRTPFTVPTFEMAMHSGTATMNVASFQGLHTCQFQDHNLFIQTPPPQAYFAPSTFVHQGTDYETMDRDSSPIDSSPPEEPIASTISALQLGSPIVDCQAKRLGYMQIAGPLPISVENFRFHATLNAPTAMIKQAEEIPMTYLNKGQAYSLSIVDTNAMIPIALGTKYRTYVRISFEDDQRRQKPSAGWSLWKGTRGTNEANQKGGKLRAVEYVESVESAQRAEGDDKRTRIELETSSFDGFSVIWTPGTNGTPKCNITVRFNFLSTDFSLTKGTKGTPMRLYAKSNTIPSNPTQPAADTNPEICYCKVKLFRDNGAERKLSNDVAHIKKTIDKLKQQTAKAESGMRDSSKRKRSGASQTSQGDLHRPGSVHKQRRTWSISSASSASSGRLHIEEDLDSTLQILQDMFTSTRPVSVLYLRGGELDDPDLHSATLPRKPREGAVLQARNGVSSGVGSFTLSSSPTSLSLASHPSVVPRRRWSGFGTSRSGERSSRQDYDQPTCSGKADDPGNFSSWIEVLGVDPSYRPPPKKTVSPIACFYIRPKSVEPNQRGYHKAVYLKQRSLKEFNAQIAAKWNIDATRILRTFHVFQIGLEVEMNDEMISELKDGQDMDLDVTTMLPEPIKRESKMTIDPSEGDESTSQTTRQSDYELRLVF